MVGEGAEFLLPAFQAIAGVEQALCRLVAAHHPAGFVEDRRAHQQAVDGGGVEPAFGVELVDGGVQVHRLLQVRQEDAHQRHLRRVKIAPGVFAAGEQRAVHAGGGAHVGYQHIAQVERLQVVAVEVVGQPGVRADHLVGAGDLFDGPVEERADRIVVLAVGRLARQ
ncbi:hypothetical protein D3C81_1528020 [compost metagenome]